MDLPPYVLRNLSGYYSSLDSRLRQVNHQLSELIPEPTAEERMDEQMDELLNLFKANCKYILDWMKSLSKIDLIISMNNIRTWNDKHVRLNIAYIRMINAFMIGLDSIGSDKEYINVLQDLISVIGQLKTWKDFKNTDVKNWNNAKQLFYNKYILPTNNPKLIDGWSTLVRGLYMEKFPFRLIR
jgi:hypothetical protein